MTDELPLFPIALALLTAAGLRPFPDDCRGYRFRMTQTTLEANTFGERTDLPPQLFGYPVDVVPQQAFLVELASDGEAWYYDDRSLFGRDE